jgi:hypothetical protein
MLRLPVIGVQRRMERGRAAQLRETTECKGVVDNQLLEQHVFFKKATPNCCKKPHVPVPTPGRI